MASKERSIVAAIVARIATVNGAPTYDHDFSASDRVLIGTAVAPERTPPVAYVFPLSVDTAQVPGRTALREYDRVLTVQVEAYVAGPADTPGSTLNAALDVQDDIMLALEGDRTLSGLVDDLEVKASAYSGEELELPGQGLAVLQVRCIYREVGGA